MVQINVTDVLIRESLKDGPDRIIAPLTVDVALVETLQSAMADGFYVEEVDHVHDFRGVGVVSGGTVAYAQQIVEQCKGCLVYRTREIDDVDWASPDDPEQARGGRAGGG